MPWTRRPTTAVLLAAALLAGCTSGDGGSAEETPTGLHGHYLDEFVTSDLGAQAGDDAAVLGVADGGDSRGVTLLAPATGEPLALAFTHELGDTASVPLPDLDPAHPQLTRIVGAGIGRVAVVGIAGGRLSIVLVERASPGPAVPVQGDLAPSAISALLVGASNYGDTLHLVVTAPDGASRVLNVAVDTGAVTAETPLAFDVPGAVRPRAIDAPFLDDDRVVVVSDVGADGTSPTPVLSRFDGALQLLERVPLAPGPAAAGPIFLDDDDQAVYATVAVPGELQVVRMPEGGQQPDLLMTLPDRTLPTWFAVDAFDDAAYLGGPATEDGTAPVTWTTVNLARGEVLDEHELCAAGRFGGADANDWSGDAWVAGRCADEDPEEPFLWRLS